MIVDQNSSINIARLAAQRWYYSSAKRVLLTQLVLDAPVIVGIGLCVALLRSPTVMGWVGLKIYDGGWVLAAAGISVALIDGLILEQLVQSKKGTAAKIQEAFDCDVLDIAWNSVLVGREADIEQILEASQKLLASQNSPSAFRDWYPASVAELPIKGARFVCQRESLSWDANLRSKFISRLGILTVTIFAILFVLGMAGDFSMRNFAQSVLAPSIPIFGLTLRQLIANQKTITETRELRTTVDDLIGRFLHDQIDTEQGEARSRNVQDAIYMHRKAAPLLPDWFYGREKIRSERIAVQAVERLVEQYRDGLSKT